MAASLSGKYFSRMVDKGMLFFLNPQKVSQVEGVKSFEYDVTMTTWNDSVTINFTCKSDVMDTPQDFKIVSGSNTYKSVKNKVLYTDIIKKGFEIRMSSTLLYRDFEAMVNNENPPTFTFVQGGMQKSASFSSGKWDKERKDLQRILSVYNYTKK